MTKNEFPGIENELADFGVVGPGPRRTLNFLNNRRSSSKRGVGTRGAPRCLKAPLGVLPPVAGRPQPRWFDGRRKKSAEARGTATSGNFARIHVLRQQDNEFDRTPAAEQMYVDDGRWNCHTVALFVGLENHPPKELRDFRCFLMTHTDVEELKGLNLLGYQFALCDF